MGGLKLIRRLGPSVGPTTKGMHLAYVMEDGEMTYKALGVGKGRNPSAEDLISQDDVVGRDGQVYVCGACLVSEQAIMACEGISAQSEELQACIEEELGGRNFGSRGPPRTRHSMSSWKCAST